MSIREIINDDLKTAMKGGDEIGKSVLRMIKSEVKNREVEKGASGELDDAAIISVIASGVKKRKESIRLFEDAGRQELADKEKSEIEFLSKYLPKQLTEEEIAGKVETAIEKLGATGMKQMGEVMKSLKSELGQSADGSLMSKIVKKKLAAL